MKNFLKTFLAILIVFGLGGYLIICFVVGDWLNLFGSVPGRFALVILMFTCIINAVGDYEPK